MLQTIPVEPVDSHYNVTSVSLTAPATLSATAYRIAQVLSDNAAHILTIPSGKSHQVQNVGPTYSFILRTTGNGDLTVQPETEVAVMWDYASGAHKVFVDRSATDVAIDAASLHPISNAAIKSYVDTEIAAAIVGGAIDSAMSDVSTNPVQNSVIKSYHDNRSLVRAGDWVIKQKTGSLATRIAADIVDWNAAKAALNSAGRGTIWIDGEVTVDLSNMYFTAPIHLRGLTSDAALRVTSNSARIAWGSYWDAIVTATGEAALTLTATVDFQELVTVPTATYAEGDLIVFYSSDELSGMLKNLTYQKPMETHQILRDEGSSTYHLGDFIRDAMTSTPKARRIPVLKQPGSNRSNLVIADLTIRQEPGVVNAQLFDVRCCKGVYFENVCWELGSTAGGPGHVSFHYCSDVRFLGNVNEGTERYNTGGEGYWCIIGAVNGFIAQHNHSRRCRHSFDTTSSSQGGTADTRWGTPRNVLIANNTIHVEGDPGGVGTLIALSTHGEGWGVTFDSNDITVSAHGTFTNAIASLRARACRFTNNRCKSGGVAKGVHCLADDLEIHGNQFYNFWRAVAYEDSYYTTYGQFDRGVIKDNLFVNGNGNDGTVTLYATDDTLIEGNTFRDCPAGGIKLMGGVATGTVDGLRVLDNKFINCPGTGSWNAIRSLATVTKASIVSNVFIDCVNEIIDLAGVGSNHDIRDNKAIRCSASNPYIKFAGDGTTTGLRVSGNDLPKTSASFSVDIGAIGTTAITLRGNILDGYGAGSMGLTDSGSGNAATVNTNQAAKNWTD